MKRDLGTQQVLLLLVHGDKAMQDRRTMFVTEDGKQWGHSPYKVTGALWKNFDSGDDFIDGSTNPAAAQSTINMLANMKALPSRQQCLFQLHALTGPGGCKLGMLMLIKDENSAFTPKDKFVGAHFSKVIQGMVVPLLQTEIRHEITRQHRIFMQLSQGGLEPSPDTSSKDDRDNLLLRLLKLVQELVPGCAVAIYKLDNERDSEEMAITDPDRPQLVAASSGSNFLACEHHSSPIGVAASSGMPVVTTQYAASDVNTVLEVLYKDTQATQNAELLQSVKKLTKDCIPTIAVPSQDKGIIVAVQRMDPSVLHPAGFVDYEVSILVKFVRLGGMLFERLGIVSNLMERQRLSSEMQFVRDAMREWSCIARSNKQALNSEQSASTGKHLLELLSNTANAAKVMFQASKTRVYLQPDQSIEENKGPHGTLTCLDSATEASPNGEQLEQQELQTVKRGGLVGLTLDKDEAVASNTNHPRYNQAIDIPPNNWGRQYIATAPIASPDSSAPSLGAIQVLRVGLMGDKFGFSARTFQQLQLFCSEMGPILTMMNEQHAAQNQIRQWQLLSNMFAQRGSNLTTLKNVAALIREQSDCSLVCIYALDRNSAGSQMELICHSTNQTSPVLCQKTISVKCGITGVAVTAAREGSTAFHYASRHHPRFDPQVDVPSNFDALVHGDWAACSISIAAKAIMLPKDSQGGEAFPLEMTWDEFVRGDSHQPEMEVIGVVQYAKWNSICPDAKDTPEMHGKSKNIMSHTMTKEESLLNNQVLQDTHQKMEGLVRHGILSHAASKYLSRVTQRFSHQVSLAGQLSQLFASPERARRFKLEELLNDFTVAIGAACGNLWILDDKKTLLQLKEEFHHNVTSGSTDIFPAPEVHKSVLSMTSAVTSMMQGAGKEEKALRTGQGVLGHIIQSCQNAIETSPTNSLPKQKVWNVTLHKVGPELTDKDQRFETNLELPDKMDSHPMACLCVLVGSTEPLAAVQFLNKDHVVLFRETDVKFVAALALVLEMKIKATNALKKRNSVILDAK